MNLLSIQPNFTYSPSSDDQQMSSINVDMYSIFAPFLFFVFRDNLSLHYAEEYSLSTEKVEIPYLLKTQQARAKNNVQVLFFEVLMVYLKNINYYFL